MESIALPTEKFDAIAHSACRSAFSFLINEEAVFVEDDCLVGFDPGRKNLFRSADGFKEGYYSVVVGYIGDAKGLITITVPSLLAEVLTVKLLDVATDGEMKEMLVDALGEFGNLFVGMIKGALTLHYPRLTLTTAKVVANGRLRICCSGLGFRKQYLFKTRGYPVLVDFCHDRPAMTLGETAGLVCRLATA